MKHKITKKLVAYFGGLILLFTITTGILFSYMFMNHSLEKNIEDLKIQANQIADTLAVNNNNMRGYHGESRHGNKRHSTNEISTPIDYARDISLLEASLQGSVWVVDNHMDLVHVGHGKHQVVYNDLPKQADQLIALSMKGETTSSESFSSVLDAPSITISAPIYNDEKQVVAVVLLHTKIATIETGIRNTILILCISLSISVGLVFILSMILANKFVKPLNRMEQVTKKMSEGNYAIRTNIKQKDEIGSLAIHIDELAVKLDESTKYMEHVEQSRKDFMTKIAHELRTPVTVIRGSLEALKDGIIEDPIKVQEYYLQMLKDSIHLERMINDLLELSRLQNPDFKIEKANENIIDIVQDAMRSLRSFIQNKNIQLIFNNDIDTYIQKVDYARIRQMFVIVLDNAIKFSKENEIIEITIIKSNKHLKIYIKDYGSGIKSEDMQNIFQKFYSTSSIQNENGSGLGLAIAKEIADRHFIKLQVNSKWQEGSEFVFTFDDVIE